MHNMHTNESLPDDMKTFSLYKKNPSLSTPLNSALDRYGLVAMGVVLLNRYGLVTRAHEAVSIDNVSVAIEQSVGHKCCFDQHGGCSAP